MSTDREEAVGSLPGDCRVAGNQKVALESCSRTACSGHILGCTVDHRSLRADLMDVAIAGSLARLCLHSLAAGEGIDCYNSPTLSPDSLVRLVGQSSRCDPNVVAIFEKGGNLPAMVLCLRCWLLIP